MSIVACSVDGCERVKHAKDLCVTHYARLRRTGTTDAPERPVHCRIKSCGRSLDNGSAKGFCKTHYTRFFRIFCAPECSIDGCSTSVRAKGLCATHYSRLRRKGDPLHRLHGEVVDGKRICPRCKIDKPVATAYGKRNTAGVPCLECSAKITAEWRRANPRPLVQGVARTCACGVEFTVNKRRSRYCSPECSGRFKNRDNWKYLNARRTRLRAAYIETFDRAEIFERDGWICQLCGAPIDPSLKFPDVLAATLDHIIPISRGGKHERSNAQAAHHRCNSAKGNRMAA